MSEQSPPIFAGDAPRERLISALRLELLGPETPDEILQQSPNTRYLVGMLAPKGTPLDPTEDEGLEGDGGEDQGDGQVPMAASLDPNSIGISFAVEAAARSVPIVLRGGEYEKVQKAQEADTEEPASIERDEDPADTADDKKKRISYEWPRAQREERRELVV